MKIIGKDGIIDYRVGTTYQVHKRMRLLYRLGRWLMHKNYIPGSNAIEHDLRLEVQELKRQVSTLSIQNTVLKTKIGVLK